MQDHNTLNLDTQDRPSKLSSGIDPVMIFNLLKRNWYWFAISAVLAIFAARFYIGHTMPVYQTGVTILINETEDRPLVDNSELLQGLGLPGGMKNLENQIMLIRSRALTERTLEQLPFDIEYYIKTLNFQSPISATTCLVLPLNQNTTTFRKQLVLVIPLWPRTAAS